MSVSLLDLWQHNEEMVSGKTFRQIIQFSGEGQLRDGNDTSKEVRSLLAALPLEKLEQFADECLSSTFTDSGLALQDIANELGVRLGFQVQPGRYRGVRDDVGFDGLWSAHDGHVLLVEVKTTDAYRINLDTIADYREQLIKSQRLKDDQSSILIAVGRQDTGDLEAQIRGSRHAWDVRLISIDALLRLASVKEQMSDWATSNQINRVLRPLEYTRIDGIIDLIFQTSQDIDNADESDEEESPPHKEKASRADIERTAQTCDKVAQVLDSPLVKKGRALRSTSDGRANVVVLASQRYDGPGGSSNYWYGFTPAQRDFIEEASEGWVAFGCADSGRTALIARDEFLAWLPEMLTTPANVSDDSAIRHWHIYFNDYGDHIDLMPISGGQKRDLVPYLVDSAKENS